MRKTVAQLRIDLANAERKWLKADTAAYQSRLVIEAACNLCANAREGEASVLMDVAKDILDRYVGDEA